MVVVALVTHRERVAGAQMDPREHAQPLEHFQRAVDRRAADAVRAQLVDECLGRKRAGLVGDRADHEVTPSRQANTAVLEPAEHPLRAGQVRAAQLRFCRVSWCHGRVSSYHME